MRREVLFVAGGIGAVGFPSRSSGSGGRPTGRLNDWRRSPMTRWNVQRPDSLRSDHRGSPTGRHPSSAGLAGRWGDLSTGSGWPAAIVTLSCGHERSADRREARKESSPMTAQTQDLETDLLGAFPAILLVLVLVLTLLGVVANVALV
jgi:hypothetical protein